MLLTYEETGRGKPRFRPLVGQTSAALITTSLENLSAICGSHSLAETMFLASLSLLRLICSEHMHTSFSLLNLPEMDFGNAFVRYFCPMQKSKRLPWTKFRTLQIDNNNYIPHHRVLSRGFPQKLFLFRKFSLPPAPGRGFGGSTDVWLVLSWGLFHAGVGLVLNDVLYKTGSCPTPKPVEKGLTKRRLYAIMYYVLSYNIM